MHLIFRNIATFTGMLTEHFQYLRDKQKKVLRPLCDKKF